MVWTPSHKTEMVPTMDRRLLCRPHAESLPAWSHCTLGVAFLRWAERGKGLSSGHRARVTERELGARLMGQRRVLWVLMWPLTWPVAFFAFQGYVVISSGLSYQH